MGTAEPGAERAVPCSGAERRGVTPGAAGQARPCSPVARRVARWAGGQDPGRRSQSGLLPCPSPEGRGPTREARPPGTPHGAGRGTADGRPSGAGPASKGGPRRFSRVPAPPGPAPQERLRAAAGTRMPWLQSEVSGGRQAGEPGLPGGTVPALSGTALLLEGSWERRGWCVRGRAGRRAQAPPAPSAVSHGAARASVGMEGLGTQTSANSSPGRGASRPPGSPRGCPPP